MVAGCAATPSGRGKADDAPSIGRGGGEEERGRYLVLETFLRTGRIGALRVGMRHGDVARLLGEPDARIDGPDPVYRYAGVEIYVSGETGLVWMLQMDPFQQRVMLPPGLGAGDFLRVPEDRAEITGCLGEWAVEYELGEFHVPGQEDLRVRESGVFVFFDDGAVVSLSVASSASGR